MTKTDNLDSTKLQVGTKYGDKLLRYLQLTNWLHWLTPYSFTEEADWIYWAEYGKLNRN